MTDEFETKFGWIPAPPEKNLLHQTQYLWSQVVPDAVAEVNIINMIPERFISWYDQDGKNACVGASSAKAMAWLNFKQIGLRQYDWWQMYCRICELDTDPQTSCSADVGAFTYASGDCLRKFGPYLVGGGWKLDEGIERYYWARKGQNGVDDVRTAISYSTQLSDSQIPCIGMPWYEKMSAAYLKQDENGTWWFPKHDNWGRQVGGHQIGIYDAVDTAQAVGFSNTWGKNWPHHVYMKYDDFSYLLGQTYAECAIFVDKSFSPPPPPPPPPPTTESITLNSVTITDNTGTYKGENIKLLKV